MMRPWISSSGPLIGQLVSTEQGAASVCPWLLHTVNWNRSSMAPSNPATLISPAGLASVYPPFTPRWLVTNPVWHNSLRMLATNGRLRPNRSAMARAVPPACFWCRCDRMSRA